MKKILLLIVLLLLTMGATYAYMSSKYKTNETIIKIGTQNVNAELMYMDGSMNTLIPYDAVVTDSYEIKEMIFILHVETTDTRSFTITHDLPPQYKLTCAYTTFQTNTNYTFTLTLLESVDVTSQTFYMWINF